MVIALRYLTGIPSFVAGWNFQFFAAASSLASYAGVTDSRRVARSTVPRSSMSICNVPVKVALSKEAGGFHAGISRASSTGGTTSVSPDVKNLGRTGADRTGGGAAAGAGAGWAGVSSAMVSFKNPSPSCFRSAIRI